MMECLTGSCPIPKEDKSTVRLSEGSGGAEMHALVHQLRTMLTTKMSWEHCMDDSAVLKNNEGYLVFTTDAYVVTPLFFPGGNIGKLAFCGTVNDLVVMGGYPLGISISLVIEEGLPKHDLFTIISTINALSQEYGIPIVTGDTKVMDKGKIDKLIITTSGVAQTQRVVHQPLLTGDKIIVSGPVGDHGAALLARRFEIESTLESDSKPLLREMMMIGDSIKQAKDITRGGLAGVLNELAVRNHVALHIQEQLIPVHKEAHAITHLLGIDILSLACEGRLVCIASPENAVKVLSLLQTMHQDAAIIGEVAEGTGVTVQTLFGKKMVPMPSGNIVPRIC